MLRTAIALAFALTTAPAYAQIFKCTDSAGKVEYRNSECPSGTTGAAVEVSADSAQPRQTNRNVVKDPTVIPRVEGDGQGADARASARPLRRSAPVEALPPPPQK